MENNKQTAVDYLVENLRLSHKEAYNDLYEVIEQAKAMEKEQIIDAHIQGHNASSSTIKKHDAKQYYEQEYGK